MTNRENLRNLFMDNLSKNMETPFNENFEASNDKSKKRSLSPDSRNQILAILEQNGYSTKDQTVASAVSLFFSNLGNI